MKLEIEVSEAEIRSAAEGYILVPINPTDEMLKVDVITDGFVGVEDARLLYKAMIAAVKG